MPMSGADYLQYGGNTSCVSVICDERLVVFDAGSGLACLSRYLEQHPGRRQLDLFISHVHLDHIIGLFGLSQLHDAEWKIRLYGESRCGMPFRRQIEDVVRKPYWPTGITEAAAQVEFFEISPGERIDLTENLHMRTVSGRHPDRSLMYRLESDGRSLVYGLDCELDAEMQRIMSGFCRDCNLLICDANFSPEEQKQHPGWGHSSWEEGVRLRRKAGARRVLMTHFSCDYTDEILREQETLAKKADDLCCFAKEGMELQI